MTPPTPGPCERASAARSQLEVDESPARSLSLHRRGRSARARRHPSACPPTRQRGRATAPPEVSQLLTAVAARLQSPASRPQARPQAGSAQGLRESFELALRLLRRPQRLLRVAL